MPLRTVHVRMSAAVEPVECFIPTSNGRSKPHAFEPEETRALRQKHPYLREVTLCRRLVPTKPEVWSTARSSTAPARIMSLFPRHLHVSPDARTLHRRNQAVSRLLRALSVNHTKTINLLPLAP